MRPPALAPTARTRVVGEVRAIVVAETGALAREAADLVQIDFDPLPAIASTAHALDDDAPKVWPEFGTNLIVHWEYGDEAEVAEGDLRSQHGYLQAAGRRAVPHQGVGRPQGKGVHGAGHGDAQPLVAEAAQILNRRQHSGFEDL